MKRRLLRITLLVVALVASGPSPSHPARAAAELEPLERVLQTRGLHVQWDAQLPLARALLDSRFSERATSSDEPRAIAERFLRENRSALFAREIVEIGELDARGGTSELRTMQIHESRAGRQVWMRQFVHGVPVHQGWVQINLDRLGRVMSVFNRYQPGLARVPTTPTFSSAAALRSARGGLDQDGPDRAETATELVVLNESSGARLCWRTTIAAWAPYGDWESFVDAQSGEILRTSNLMIHGKPLKEAPRMSPPAMQYPKASTALAMPSRRVDGSGDVLPANPLNGLPSRYGLRDGDAVAGFVENKVLPRLDGSGTLTGSYVDVANSDAPRANEASLVFNFSPDVTDGSFHEVNVYWHIDTIQHYIQTELGIFDANNRQLACFVHQGEDDNSDYSPIQDRIRYGDGGVDDSEDGEIVIHEYGHAIHENMVPGFVYAGQSGAISEAFGDYLACSFGENPLEGEWDATSYNPGPPPFLRRLDNSAHYPENIVNQVHTDGLIIGGAWWDLRNMLGKQATDQLVIESFNLLGAIPNHSFQDFANATVQVDQSLNGGANLVAIYAAYGGRGIGSSYLLDIVHTPLSDSVDLDGPYLVETRVDHSQSILAGAVQLHWRATPAAVFQTVPMDAVGGDIWTAEIPGNGSPTVFEYYLSVTDDGGFSTSSPLDAPASLHSFTVGADQDPPIIVHDALGAQILARWPVTLTATVTDNIGVGSVSVDWSLNGASQLGFALDTAGGDAYSGVFPLDPSALAPGDLVEYTIHAADVNETPLESSAGPFSFEIIEPLGVILIIDDDNSPAATSVKFGRDGTILAASRPRAPQEKGVGAELMATQLEALGYYVEIESSLATDPNGWSFYDLLIHSSGSSNEPMLDPNYRTALVDYATAGGKLLVEGGEVGYDALESPGYPDVAASILHCTSWDRDNSGDLQANAGTDSHPLRTTPNALAATLAIAYSGNWGDQDAVLPAGDAALIYGTADLPTWAGVLVFDDNFRPQSAQILYFAFALARVEDPIDAAALLENAVAYLLAEEPVGSASISGHAWLQNTPDHSGTLVTAEPGGRSLTTGANGAYSFGDLDPGSYTITTTPPAGWETLSQVVILDEGEQRSGIDFEMRPTLEITVCDGQSLPIPDLDPDGLLRSLAIAEGGEVLDINCTVSIVHGDRGELRVELSSPRETTVRLHDGSGVGQANLITSYPDPTPADGPGSMSDFVSEDALGDWSFFVADEAGPASGSLSSWCITLTIAQAGSLPVLVSGFDARLIDGDVHLSWTAAATGGLRSFEVLRDEGSGFVLANSVPLPARDGAMQFVDPAPEFPAGNTLVYALEASMHDGSRQRVGEAVSIAAEAGPRRQLLLNQNHPNPFNPATSIAFFLPAEGPTQLRIYDSAGRLVRTLVDAPLAEGAHRFSWRGLDDRGRTVSAGSYYYRLSWGGRAQTRAMVLIK